MASIIHAFSILVASGNGQRCNDLKKILRSNLYDIDQETSIHKLAIWKYGRRSEPEAHKRVSKEIAQAVTPLYKDVDDAFFQ